MSLRDKPAVTPTTGARDAMVGSTTSVAGVLAEFLTPIIPNTPKEPTRESLIYLHCTICSNAAYITFNLVKHKISLAYFIGSPPNLSPFFTSKSIADYESIYTWQIKQQLQWYHIKQQSHGKQTYRWKNNGIKNAEKLPLLGLYDEAIKIHILPDIKADPLISLGVLFDNVCTITLEKMYVGPK